jgi:hypothetical protein
MKKLATLFALLLLVGSFYCQAQQFTVDTLKKTGPIDRRINVVILGDGFTQSELPEFDSEARKFMAFFLSYTPFNDYKNYFNFFSIRVPSNNSGATNPGTAPDRYPDQPVEAKDTYFGASFGIANIHRLVAITKRQAFSNVMANNFPSYDLAILIVNSTWYGGSGGNPATFTLNQQANLIGAHEIGHLFSSLSDEYWAGKMYAYETANQTRNTNPATVTWKNWMNQFNVGIYQHAGDADALNWYKPTTHECLMEQLDKQFCAVCREATSNRILNLVHPVETISPSPNSSVRVESQPAHFQLDMLLPEPNTLRTQWRLNGVLLNQKADRISISNNQLPQAINELKVTVFDTTDYIRLSSHAQSHTYTYSWTLEKANIDPNFSILASKAVSCAGQSLTLTAQNCNGSVTWSNGGTGVTQMVAPTQTTTYSAVCAVANAPSQNAQVEVTVNPLPTAVASNSGPYLEGETVRLNAGGGVEFAWSGPAGFSSSLQNPTIQSARRASAGTYTVVVSSAQGCTGNAQTTVEISPILATASAIDDNVIVFPNPASGLILVKSALQGEQTITLLDANGRQLFSDVFNQSIEISTDGLPDKLYFYRISNGQQTVSGKVLIQRE